MKERSSWVIGRYDFLYFLDSMFESTESQNLRSSWATVELWLGESTWSRRRQSKILEGTVSSDKDASDDCTHYSDAERAPICCSVQHCCCEEHSLFLRFRLALRSHLVWGGWVKGQNECRPWSQTSEGGYGSNNPCDLIDHGPLLVNCIGPASYSLVKEAIW